MNSVVLEYGDRQARWEATIDGCVVEIARQLNDDGQTLVDTHAFATPRLAREFIDDEVDRLIAAGSRDRRPDANAATPVPTPGDAVMQQVARMTPTTCENPQLLARIRSDPVVDTQWDAFKDDAFDLDED